MPERDKVVLQPHCNHSLFVLVLDCTNVRRAKKNKVEEGHHTPRKMIYKGRFCSRGRARNINCYPVQFYFRWFAQIGGEISASNQLALAVSLSRCFSNAVLVCMKEVSVTENSAVGLEDEFFTGSSMETTGLWSLLSHWSIVMM